MIWNNRRHTIAIPKNCPIQDSCAVFSDNGCDYIVVADGVGGNGNGEIASSTVVNSVMDIVKSQNDVSISTIFERARSDLISIDVSDNGMATTLTVAKIVGDKLYIGHVGDCRVYLLRGCGLKTLTVDQNEAQFLIDEGVIDKKFASTYPRRNILTSSISARTDYSLYLNEFDLHARDRVLVMSDGCYNLISKREFVDLNIASSDIDILLAGVEKKLIELGVKDDATIAAVEVD